MNAFEKRPLALGAAVFLLTSALLFSCSANLKLSIAVSCAAVAAVLLIMSGIKSGGLYETLRPIKGALLLCLCAVMLSSLISLFCVSREYDEVSVYIGNECFVRGYVTDTVYESSYGGYYKVQLTEIDGSEVSFGALLDLGFSAGLEAGDIFSAEVSFDELDDDGYFEEKSYYSKDGIIASLLCEDDAVFSVVGTKEGITYQMIALRSKISAILEVMTERAGESEGAYGIPEALLVGDRSNLDDTVYRDFKYIGASHLLAISGLHFSVLIGGFEAILKRMGAGRRVRALLIIAASIFYMAFSGFSSSVLRAGIMMIIYSLSYFSRREPDRITSLFVSGALIVAASPYSAADTVLLLSVTAM
ncbi:MAG: ComEC/Rec2 family competence protein, partial [Firmicutes bacterium]|nr:ComEC/Rec2 family competence protein [Bacillota bacterium]